MYMKTRFEIVSYIKIHFQGNFMLGHNNLVCKMNPDSDDSFGHLTIFFLQNGVLFLQLVAAGLLTL